MYDMVVALITSPLRTFDLIEFVVDSVFIFVKRVLKCIFETLILIFIFLFTATLIFPHIAVFYLHDCYNVSECPEVLELKTRKSAYRYLLELACESFQPVWNYFWELYYRHMFRVAFREFLLYSGLATFQTWLRVFGIAEDLFIHGLEELRIIFDSGASTNLIFHLLPKDVVAGKRDLNLAAGEKSSGDVTHSGEILMPPSMQKKCNEQLISMGRYSWRCGPVTMDGDSCYVFLRDKDGSCNLLYTLPVVNNCPRLTREQAQHLRELQRAALDWGSFWQTQEMVVEDDFSPSLALLDRYSELFDKHYYDGAFQGHEELFDNFLPSDIASCWDGANEISSSSPVTYFLFELALLRREQLEATPSISDTVSQLSSVSQNIYPTNVGGLPIEAPRANPTWAEREESVHSSDLDDILGSDQPESHVHRTEDPLTLTFSEAVTSVLKLKHGVNPNAMKSPQTQTSLQEKLKFYRSTKGAWVIWGDVHFSSHKGYDSSASTWVYHCSRLQPKNPQKPTLDEIETVELNFPIKENTGQMACAGLRHCLECLGIWTDNAKTKVNFYFETEGENSLDAKLVEEYVISCHGHHHFSVPYRHPAKEFAVKNLLSKIRHQLEKASLPASAWPAVARAINEEACAKIKDRPYPNRTFLKGYTADMVGRSVNAFVPGLKRGSVDSKQVPAILLNSAPRDRVWIIHATDKELGFRHTAVQWSQVSFSQTEDWVFTSDHLSNLRLLKYMKAPFQSRLIAKTKKERPRTLTCKRCVRLHNRGDENDCEDDHPVKGHTCDGGCNYFGYDCFTDVEFSEDVHHFCPMAAVLQEILEYKEPSFHAVDLGHGGSDGSPSVRSCFDRPIESQASDHEWFHSLKTAFEDPLLRSQVLNCPKLTAEMCATLLFLARDEILHQMFLTLEEEKDKCARNDYSDEEYFGMVIVKNKDVLDQCTKCPKDLMKWLEANNKELENLIDRGVLKLVKMSELKNWDRNSYELIPSLVVYSVKNDGRNKARLVACGNFQIPANKQTEGLQSGVYAGTTSQIVWRSLINIFAQSRNSVAAMDVSEAFTQTDEHSQGKRDVRTFLRLPSQWKSMIMPTVLRNAGCNSERYNEFLLQVLKSIYGETFAPKRWQETLKRVLTKFGFCECQLEESLYFRIKNNKIIVISTYVDDIWFFSQDPEEMVRLMYLISKELRCTPGEVLCGAPDWLWDTPCKTETSSLNEVAAASSPSISDTEGAAHFSRAELTEEQKQIKAFFKPLVGTPRFGVATKEDPLSYVSIDIYFKDDYLILDQSKYIEKSFSRMKDKKVFEEIDQFQVNSLRAETFNHLVLFEPIESNPLLSKQELSLLRIGVNTLSFYACSVGVHLQAALGQIARGQAAGRKRHLDALRILIFYCFQNRNQVLKIECPSWVKSEFDTLSKLRIFTKAHCDASMGHSSSLGTDAHARHGFMIMVGVLSGYESLVSGKSSLQTTVSLSTCEAELTASSWTAKQLLGLINLFTEVFQGAHIDVPQLYADNKAANLLASNQASMRNHRHLQLPQIWIRQQSKDDKIKIFDINTKLNTSDMLTKVLDHDSLMKLLAFLGYSTS